MCLSASYKDNSKVKVFMSAVAERRDSVGTIRVSITLIRHTTEFLPVNGAHVVFGVSSADLNLKTRLQLKVG